MALKNSTKSPSDVIRERKGFLTNFKIPGVFDIKQDSAKINKNTIDK